MKKEGKIKHRCRERRAERVRERVEIDEDR